METYLITGGAGFIGSNFISYLYEKEPSARIINIDKLTYAGNLDNLKALSQKENYFFIKEDICNEEDIRNIFSLYRPNFVINFAAESHVDRSIDSCGVFVKTNVFGTQVLLQASIEYGIKKYVQISTDEVYGQSEGEEAFNESSPLRPRNPYAASKAGGDVLVQAYNTTYGLPVNITRCTNNYGPNQNQEKFIPLIIKNCLEAKKVSVYGDGKNMRDWIHVLDNCSAIYTVLKRGIASQIYNISANNEWENIDIAKLIIKEMSCLLGNYPTLNKEIGEDLIEYVNDRKGHDKRYVVSSQKLRDELGWAPAIDFHEGLIDTIKWYLDNKRVVNNYENSF